MCHRPSRRRTGDQSYHVTQRFQPRVHAPHDRKHTSTRNRVHGGPSDAVYRNQSIETTQKPRWRTDGHEAVRPRGGTSLSQETDQSPGSRGDDGDALDDVPLCECDQTNSDAAASGPVERRIRRHRKQAGGGRGPTGGGRGPGDLRRGCRWGCRSPGGQRKRPGVQGRRRPGGTAALECVGALERSRWRTLRVPRVFHQRRHHYAQNIKNKVHENRPGGLQRTRSDEAAFTARAAPHAAERCPAVSVTQAGRRRSAGGCLGDTTACRHAEVGRADAVPPASAVPAW